MNKKRNEKWLDKLISRTINTTKPEFDVEKWKQKYPDEFQSLLSRVRQASPRQPNIWRTILKSPITKLAAAAVIILCAVLYLLVTFQKSAQDQPTIAVTKTVRPKVASSGMATAMLVAYPPGPGEVCLDRNLDGEKLNRPITKDGWIQIGKGIFWYYTGGTYLDFTQEDVRVYVTADDEPRQLAGLRFSKPNDIGQMRVALEELTEPTILWCGCQLPREFSQLPNLDMIIELQRIKRRQGLWNLDKTTYMVRYQPITFTDLSPLSGLTGLASLNLSGCNQITNLSPLASLTNLTSLNLAGCDSITDLSPLANLSNLESLDLSAWDGDTKLSDLSPLSSLTALRTLNLRLRMNVSDLSPLGQLTELESLNLSSRQISDLSPLAQLRKLRSLKLSSVWNVTDLSPLAELTSLEFLRLGSVNRRVTDISYMANLTKLKHLDLDQWQRVTDISSLASLTSLTSLRLKAFRKLSDISPLAQLTNLESLDLESCEQISDLSPLENLTKLKSLDLCACKNVSDLSPLANLTKLRDVSLQFCPKVTDLSSLREGIGQGANIQVQTASGTTNAPLTKQLSEIRSQILAERIAEASTIISGKLVEITDTLLGEELISTELKVKVTKVLYGQVPGEVINVVLPEPDAEWSTASLEPDESVILFLADRSEQEPYMLIYRRKGFLLQYEKDITDAVKNNADLSTNSPD